MIPTFYVQKPLRINISYKQTRARYNTLTKDSYSALDRVSARVVAKQHCILARVASFCTVNNKMGCYICCSDLALFRGQDMSSVKVPFDLRLWNPGEEHVQVDRIASLNLHILQCCAI